MTSTKVCVAELRPSVHVDVRFQITANLISTTEIRAQSLTLANDPTRTLTYTKRLQSGQKAIMGRQPPEAEQPGSFLRISVRYLNVEPPWFEGR